MFSLFLKLVYEVLAIVLVRVLQRNRTDEMNTHFFHCLESWTHGSWLWQKLYLPRAGLWFKAYTTFWRTLPQPSTLPPPNWCFNSVFKRSFRHSTMLAASEWWEYGKRWAQGHTSLAVKSVPWSEAMLCWTLWWWIKHLVRWVALERHYMQE